MSTRATRVRRIPFSRCDIPEMLVAGKVVSAGEERNFRDFCGMLSAVFHHEVHAVVERLKSLYRPHNPDGDATRLPTDGTSADSAAAFVESFESLLNQANYERLSRAEVEEAYRSAAVLNIPVRVRRDTFADDRFYGRGPAIHTRVERSWWWLRRRRVEFEVYDRVVLLVRMKDAGFFAATGCKPPAFGADTIAIKLFKAVPKADLEVLYPGSDVTMRLRDRLVLGVVTVAGGVPLLGKLGMVLTVVFTMIAGVLGYEGIADEDRLTQALASLTAAAALGSFAFQRWASYQNQRNVFHRALSHNLYFRNVANNESAIFHLADSAEEEEVKEMLLAYAFTLAASGRIAAEALDEAVESWFRETHACELAFECPDALRKLERFGLVHTLPDGCLAALPLVEALARLDTIWGDAFRFSRGVGEGTRGT